MKRLLASAALAAMLSACAGVATPPPVAVPTSPPQPSPPPAPAPTPPPVAAVDALARGINADNVIMTSRMVTYEPATVARLRGMGFTYARIPAEIGWLIPGIPTAEGGVSDAARVAQGWAALDAAMASFTSGGMAVMPVLFVNRAVYARPDAQALIIQGVTMIAARYATKYTPAQLYFDALNEPFMDNATWNVLAPKVVAAIRAAAPNDTIIVPPAKWDLAANFKDLTPINDPNVVYTMHVYEPSKLTAQGSGGGHNPGYVFPKPAGSTDNTTWTAARLDQYIMVGVDWAKANHARLIMNEFGTTSVGDKASRMAWIKQVRATAEANGVGWAWWAYDGRLFGLNPHEKGYDPDLVALLSK